MTYHHWSKFALFGVAMSALQGCADSFSWVNDRWGPSPTLAAAASADVANRQVAVVNAMIAASGLVRLTPDPVTGQMLVPQPSKREDWYTAITGGFNVIDDACQTYLDDLWKLDREKTTMTGVIAATGAAVAAVVNPGGTGTATTLIVLAQAFGLAQTLTTNIANTYLYAKDPATVKGLVDKMMEAYRQDFIDKAYDTSLGEKKFPIESYPAAYYRMRGYLSLCLPPTIDAQVQALLANAGAVPKAPAPSKNGNHGGSAPGAGAPAAASRGLLSTNSITLVGGGR